MNVCIQINIDNEASKGGIDIDNYSKPFKYYSTNEKY
jgi:uncharacterized pyridoxal phosphate-containing UPF0001 family protein